MWDGIFGENGLADSDDSGVVDPYETVKALEQMGAVGRIRFDSDKKAYEFEGLWPTLGRLKHYKPE